MEKESAIIYFCPSCGQPLPEEHVDPAAIECSNCSEETSTAEAIMGEFSPEDAVKLRSTI